MKLAEVRTIDFKENPMVMKQSHLVSMEKTHQLSQNARQKRLLQLEEALGGALFGQMVREQVVRLE